MSVGKASRKKEASINEALGNQGRHEKELKPSQESPLKGSLQRTTSIITFIPILIIVLVSFAVYFNAFFGDFVYDDQEQIVKNPWIRDIGNIPTIFSKNVWGFQPGVLTSNYYRPLMHIVYMLNYHVFGLNPRGFHLINIFFHCAASVLVFLIIRRFLTDHGVTTSSVYLSPPFIAAVLFASHPVHTEAVTWISGLPDVAFTFFYLLSFYLYIFFRAGNKRGYLLSILSFSVAILFKEPALTLPIMLIVYDYLLKISDETLFARIKRYLPYIVVSAIYLLMRYYALRGVAPTESYSDLSTYQFVINVFPLFREYLTSLLWPFNLNFWHTFHPINSLVEAKGMISVVLTVIFIIAAGVAFRKNKLIFLGLLLLVIPLVPAFYIKGIGGKPFAERYLYLSSAGYVLLLAVFLSCAKEKPPHTAKSVAIVFMIIVGLYSVGTIKRNNIWKDDLKLSTDTVKKSPHSADAHAYIGTVYASQGQLDRAIAEYQTAVRLKPDFIQPHYNLGIAFVSQGQWDRAIAEFQTVLRLKFDNAVVHYNLGVAYRSQGQWDRAIAEYQEALRLEPESVKAHYNLAFAYASQGQWDRAIAEYQTVLWLQPDFYEARQRLNNIVSRRH